MKFPVLIILAGLLLLSVPVLSADSPPTCPSKAPYNKTCQAMLALAYTANLSGDIQLADPKTNRLERLTHVTAERIDDALKTVTALGGEWKRTWGPALVLQPNTQVLRTTSGPKTVIIDTWDPAPVANTMFVAKQKNAEVYVIAIAGTNPASGFDWEKEDLDAYPIPWPYGDHKKSVRVTRGTVTGLNQLQSMTAKVVPGGTIPLSLQAYLNSLVSRAPTFYFTGHSLGGALAPATALWLRDTNPSWINPGQAELKIYAFAGPTPGDRKFRDYVFARFPGDATVVVNNSLDVVPHAFRLDTLRKLKTLYQSVGITPTPQESAAIQKIINHVKEASLFGIDFRVLGEGTQDQGFTGDLKSPPDLDKVQGCPLYTEAAKKLGDDNYAKEAIYQHVCAYPVQLDLPNLNSQIHKVHQKYPGN